MDSKTYIRACALFMFDQGKNSKEATRVISELYPEDAMTERTCERWFAKFREGDRSIQDLPRTGHPQILDRQSLKTAIDADSGVTSRELAIEFGCCQRTIINALYDIGKVSKRRMWIPFKLTENHKIQRMITCQSMLSMAKRAKFTVVRLRPSARTDPKTPKICQKCHAVCLVEYARNCASRSTGKRRDN